MDGDGWGMSSKSKTSGLISKGAPQKVKDDLAMQDAHLEEMSNGLDELYDIGLAIGTEVEVSTKQVQNLSRKVDDATVRMDQQNAKVERVGPVSLIFCCLFSP